MNEHYFTASPSVAADEREHTFVIRGREHRVMTSSGVFSSHRLDKGTQVLLDHVPDPPQEGTFLDLGCGWGPITLALADAAPGATVLATDLNERSLSLTAHNAAAAGHVGVRTVQPGALLAELGESGVRLDLIWSNPPVRIGKKELHTVLLSWFSLLSDKGEAWLVVSKNLGADSLTTWLGDQGLDVRKEASSKGFRVLRVRPEDA